MSHRYFNANTRKATGVSQERKQKILYILTFFHGIISCHILLSQSTWACHCFLFILMKTKPKTILGWMKTTTVFCTQQINPNTYAQKRKVLDWSFVINILLLLLLVEEKKKRERAGNICPLLKSGQSHRLKDTLIKSFASNQSLCETPMGVLSPSMLKWHPIKQLLFIKQKEQELQAF